jgi:leucyl/phenylalanyl-tRNA--protein transferase
MSGPPGEQQPTPTARTEPQPTAWLLPDAAGAPAGMELLGVGADLEPGTLLAAYRAGLFPMPIEADGPLGWWSPDPRGLLPLGALRVSRSLRRSCARLNVTVDESFAEVVGACADPSRDGGWIDSRILESYAELHRLGWAHSVEVRDDDGTLVGGLYGVEIGGLFAGESMFSRVSDASKVALAALVSRLRAAPGGAEGQRLLDVQWRTHHLASLGVVDVPRSRYLAALRVAVLLPPAF